jgi:hypothetical protein
LALFRLLAAVTVQQIKKQGAMAVLVVAHPAPTQQAHLHTLGAWVIPHQLAQFKVTMVALPLDMVAAVAGVLAPWAKTLRQAARVVLAQCRLFPVLQ